MSKANLYTFGVKSTKQIELPKAFDAKINEGLLAQVIHVHRNRLHGPGGRTKTRSQISLRKGKAYKQKGTGNARHGAKSAPLFVGGSKAHGPKGEKRVLQIPVKMRKQALGMALASKARDGKVIFVDSLSKIKKTKDAAAFIKEVREAQKANRSKVTIVLSEENADLKRVFSNLDKTKVEEYRNINAYRAYLGGLLIFDKQVFESKKVSKQTK